MTAWLETLRAAAAATSQTVAGRRIGYSATVVSQVLSGTYPGDVRRVQAAVEEALMAQTVDCPVVGDMPRQKCVEHQRAQRRQTNPMAVALYHACRNGCHNSLIPPERTDAAD
jgi:hypothetical protein